MMYRGRTRKGSDEDAEQIRLASYLDSRGFLWCHVPNGGRRSRREGGKFKRMGVKPGVPDILIFDTDRAQEATGLAIEMKRSDGKGRVRKEQKQWLADLRARGWMTAVCHGFEEARKVIERHYGS